MTVSEYILTGAHAAEFQVPVNNIVLTPLQSQNLSVIFSPVTVGPKTAAIIFYSNAPTSPDTVALSGSATAPAYSISITYPSEPVAGNDLGIAIDLQRDFTATTQLLYYRNIGETEYSSVQLTGSGSEYNGTIPDEVVQLRGIEYYIMLGTRPLPIRTRPSIRRKTRFVQVSLNTISLRLFNWLGQYIK